MKKKYMYRGISELLALVLGLAITIAIGIAFYAFLPSFISTSIQQQKAAISIASVTFIDSRNLSIVINIKNLGTKDIDRFNISIEVPGASISDVSVRNIAGCQKFDQTSVTNTTKCIYTISSGQEISLLIRVRGTGFSHGQRVIVTLFARYIDNSMYTASASSYISM